MRVNAPGPRGLAIGRWLGSVRRDPLGTVLELRRTYGDLVAIEVGPLHAFIASRPEHVEHVHVANQANYVKAMTYRPLMEALGHGLLTNEGEPWARQRRLVQPMFARRHVVGFAPVMTETTRRRLDTWAARPAGTTMDVAAELSALTLEIVGHALFGTGLAGDAAAVGPAMTVLLRAAVARVRNPATLFVPALGRIPTPSTRRYLRALGVLDGVVDRLIREHRARPVSDLDSARDLLDMLLVAHDETGAGMDDRQVRDEVMTFLLAGHETTANALAWTAYLLSTHPEVRQRLFDEVDAVLGGREPTADDCDKLEWTSAVLDEAMRLYPPAWTIERQALDDDELSGVHVPAGSVVVTAPYVVHRDPEYWANPEGFDPTRFLPGADAGRPRYAYFPFGAGRRQCVGSGFAMLEAVLVLAMMAQRFRLDAAFGERPVPEATVTLRPRDGLRMTLHQR